MQQNNNVNVNNHKRKEESNKKEKKKKSGKDKRENETLLKQINDKGSLPGIFQLQMDTSNPLDELNMYH